MSSTKLIGVFGLFGHVTFSFTRGVTEHYNPEEPKFTAESFSYDPLQSTSREWNYLPVDGVVDELIYQEYSERDRSHQLGLSSVQQSRCKGYRCVKKHKKITTLSYI